MLREEFAEKYGCSLDEVKYDDFEYIEKLYTQDALDSNVSEFCARFCNVPIPTLVDIGIIISNLAESVCSLRTQVGDLTKSRDFYKESNIKLKELVSLNKDYITENLVTMRTSKVERDTRKEIKELLGDV